MKSRIVLCVGFFLSTSVLSIAQSNPRYIQFRPGSVKGALYKPDSGTAPHVAILAIHRTANFMSHSATMELSKRHEPSDRFGQHKIAKDESGRG